MPQTYLTSRVGLIALLALACGRPAAPEHAAPVLAPAVVAERFLLAAEAQDLEMMARMFGTHSGSVLQRDGRDDSYERMATLASLLAHDRFTIAGERRVPGRSAATEILADMIFGEEAVRVPLTLVRTRQGSWLVEQVDLESLAAYR
jgi:hypothetical protein